MSIDYGSVLNLFVKQHHRVALKEVEKINLEIGHGIEGDINSNFISPRQVLVVNI